MRDHLSEVFDTNNDLESFQERDLRVEIAIQEGRFLLRELRKRGEPRNEEEEERMWERIESSVEKNKVVKKKLEEFLTY